MGCALGGWWVSRTQKASLESATTGWSGPAVVIRTWRPAGSHTGGRGKVLTFISLLAIPYYCFCFCFCCFLAFSVCCLLVLGLSLGAVCSFGHRNAECPLFIGASS
jgi:hypothetical protein